MKTFDPQTTPMRISEAVESLKKSLAHGDELMKSETWSGGDFKSQAIRTILIAYADEQDRKAAALEENLMMGGLIRGKI